jgi:hypothetical protein
MDQFHNFGKDAVRAAMITVAADYRLQPRREKAFIV